MSELPGVQAVALDNTAGLFSLSADTLAVLFFALQYAENLENWKDFPDEQLSTADIDDIERLVGVATYEVLNMVHQIPIGTLAMYAGSAVPTYWLTCDGTAMLRADYPDLFDVIGTTWGAGNGSTTFNLPNLKDKMPMGVLGSVVPDVADSAGALTHTLTTAELPSHNHTLTDPGHNHTINMQTGGGAGSNNVIVAAIANVSTTPNLKNTNTNTTGITIAAAGSGNAHSILNPVVGVHFMIYAGV